MRGSVVHIVGWAVLVGVLVRAGAAGPAWVGAACAESERLAGEAAGVVERAGAWASERWGEARGWTEARWEAGERAVDGALERVAVRHRARLGVFEYVPGAEGAFAPGWVRPGTELGERVVLLVHGLDEPGGVWKDMAPELHAAGYAVLRLEYANDQGIAASGSDLSAALRCLRGRGVERVDLVCHSMGGLVAREALTLEGAGRDWSEAGDEFPAVGRLVTLGTPHYGAPLARLRGVQEVRDHVARWARRGGSDPEMLAAFLADGRGEAGEDLLPGSAFLESLNARPHPEGVAITSVVGIVGATPASGVRSFLAGPLVGRVTPESWQEAMVSAVSEAEEAVGDGVVPADSAVLAGVEDVVILDVDHRSMVRRMGVEVRVRRWMGQRRELPPAIPVVLDRLGGGGGDGGGA